MTRSNESDWDRAVEALGSTPARQQAAKGLETAATHSPLAAAEVERLVAAAIAADRPRLPARVWARRAAVAGLLLVVASLAARRGALAWSQQRPATSRWTWQDAARQALIHPDETTRSDAVALLESHGDQAIAQLRDAGQAAGLAQLRLHALGPAGALVHETLSTPAACQTPAALVETVAAAATRLFRARPASASSGAATTAATFHAILLAIESAPLTTAQARAQRGASLRWLRFLASPLSESRCAAPAHRAR